MSNEYGRTIELSMPFDEAVPRVREALADHGFGVLTEIDVRSTLAGKLGVDMEPYLILGACNPPLAHRALEADRSVGMLLPCNVVVRAGDGGGSIVQALNPAVLVDLTGRDDLRPVAAEARRRLDAALDALG